MIEKSIEVERLEHIISVFGSFDRNLRIIESELGLVRLGLPYLREQVGNGCEVYAEALHTGFYAKAYGNMGLAGPGIPIHNYIAPLAYEVKSLELREKIPAIGRKIFSDKFLKVLQLGEVGLLYSHILPVLDALFNLSLQEDAQELAIVPLLGGSIGYNVIQAVLDSRKLELLYIFINELVIWRVVVHFRFIRAIWPHFPLHFQADRGYPRSLSLFR